MIIPIRCMGCGNVIADKWRKYQERLKMRTGNTSENSILYIDGSKAVQTPEGETLDELGLRRDCCRKHFLTHVDLIEKL
jgi:DNA-directed RNA polymerase subunit N (RpoN/RPB10)